MFKVDFPEDRGFLKTIASQEDLNFMMVVTNMSHETIKFCTELIYDDTSSPFANYYSEYFSSGILTQ